LQFFERKVIPGVFHQALLPGFSQVLFTGNDFMIIYFDGEPAQIMSERRINARHFIDVAGMILEVMLTASKLSKALPELMDELDT
jgi:predicted trehalose synthase